MLLVLRHWLRTHFRSLRMQRGWASGSCSERGFVFQRRKGRPSQVRFFCAYLYSRQARAISISRLAKFSGYLSGQNPARLIKSLRLPRKFRELGKPLSFQPSFLTPMSSEENVTDLLIAWSDGHPSALNRLMPLIEVELRRLARNYMRREDSTNTLQTTALVNELYLKLVDQRKAKWQNRAHFFAVAAQLMRRILIDHARRNIRNKRGGGIRDIPLDDVVIISQEKSRELLALDEALTRLAAIDPLKSKVVELRHFGGLSVRETAEVLKIAEITVMRHWGLAKTWLRREVRGS